jgi:hypothetical protein
LGLIGAVRPNDLAWCSAKSKGASDTSPASVELKVFLSLYPEHGRALHVSLCLNRGQTCNTHMLNALVYTNSLAICNCNIEAITP